MLPSDLTPEEREAWKDFIYDSFQERSTQFRKQLEIEGGPMGWQLFQRESDGDPTVAEAWERVRNFPGRYGPPADLAPSN